MLHNCNRIIINQLEKYLSTTTELRRLLIKYNSLDLLTKLERYNNRLLYLLNIACLKHTLELRELTILDEFDIFKITVYKDIGKIYRH